MHSIDSVTAHHGTNTLLDLHFLIGKRLAFPFAYVKMMNAQWVENAQSRSYAGRKGIVMEGFSQLEDARLSKASRAFARPWRHHRGSDPPFVTF